MIDLAPFEPLIHTGRIHEFSRRLCRESKLEIAASEDSSFLNDGQVINQSLVQSLESYLFMQGDSIRGACGVAKKYTRDSYLMVPWFLTDGFEREPENRYDFLCFSCLLMKKWARGVPSGISFCNICLDDPRITKWLSRWLGFSISPVPAKEFRGKRFMWFHGRGGDLSVYSKCRPATCRSKHGFDPGWNPKSI